MVDNNYPLKRKLIHDGVVHHPLGGGSYVFKNNLRINIGAQPNSSPDLVKFVKRCEMRRLY